MKRFLELYRGYYSVYTHTGLRRVIGAMLLAVHCWWETRWMIREAPIDIEDID